MQTGKIIKSLAEKGDMEKINLYSRRELTEDEVYIFTASLCDNDIDRDFERFSVSALYELAELFVGKTGIADHSMKSADQKARIFHTYVEKQEGEKTSDGQQLYCLKARAYMLKSDENKSLIDEIDAGIKKELSVSCSMGSSVCSVCKKDRKKERCEHIAGRVYSGSQCYFTLENAKDAYEFSFVAVPAQRKAGVTKSYKNKKEFDMERVIDEIKACKEVSLSESDSKEVASYLDSLEEKASLGEAYKKELSKEVEKLFALNLPELDRELISSVVSVMTANELIGFKKGFEKTKRSAKPQLLSEDNGKKKSDYSEFRI